MPWLTLIPGGAGCAIFRAWLFSQQQSPVLMLTPISFQSCNTMPLDPMSGTSQRSALSQQMSSGIVLEIQCLRSPGPTPPNCAITRIRHAVPRLMLNLDPGSSRSGTRFAGRVRLPSTCSQARIVMRHPAAAIYARLMRAPRTQALFNITRLRPSSLPPRPAVLISRQQPTELFRSLR